MAPEQALEPGRHGAHLPALDRRGDPDRRAVRVRHGSPLDALSAAGRQRAAGAGAGDDPGDGDDDPRRGRGAPPRARVRERGARRRRGSRRLLRDLGLQPLLLDLAELVARQLVDEVDDPRALVRREQPRDRVRELAGVDGGALAPDDPRHDTLAEVLVGLAGDRGVLDGLVLAQRGFDLAGADLVAAALDEVRRAPPDDADVVARGAGGEVARAEPAVAHRLLGRIGAVEVAEEEVRPADLDLADRLVVGLAVERPAVVVREADLDAAQRWADVARAAVAVGAHAADHQRLRHPVALHHALAGEPLEPLMLRGGEGRRAGH